MIHNKTVLYEPLNHINQSEEIGGTNKLSLISEDKLDDSVNKKEIIINPKDIKYSTSNNEAEQVIIIKKFNLLIM